MSTQDLEPEEIETDLEPVVSAPVTHIHAEASKVEISMKTTITAGHTQHWLGATISHTLAGDEDMDDLIDYTVGQTREAIVKASNSFLEMHRASTEAANRRRRELAGQES